MLFKSLVRPHLECGNAVLRPILFVIFKNDMPGMVENLCQLFANSAKLFYSVNLRDEEKNKSLQKKWIERVPRTNKPN